MELSSSVIQVGGLSTHFLCGGKGRPVLLLHGWGSSAERYREALQYLPEEAGTFYLPDLPGFGETEMPTTPWTIALYAEWVEKFLQNIGWKQGILIGHSFGGAVAVLTATAMPDRYTHLVLYSVRGFTKRSPLRLLLFHSIAKGGSGILRLPGLGVFAPLAKRLLYTISGSHDYRVAGAMKKTMQVVIQEDITPFLSRIHIPLHLLWGTNDRATPFSDTEQILSRIPQAMLHAAQGMGHAIHRENPSLFAAMLQEILTACI